MSAFAWAESHTASCTRMSPENANVARRSPGSVVDVLDVLLLLLDVLEVLEVLAATVAVVLLVAPAAVFSAVVPSLHAAISNEPAMARASDARRLA